MKRSFFIKQLKSLKNQVESLLEAEGDVAENVSGLTITMNAMSSVAKKMGLSDVDPKDPKFQLTVLKAASDRSMGSTFATAIKSDWGAFKDQLVDLKNYVDSALTENVAMYVTLKKYYVKISDGLEATYKQVQAGTPDFWNNAASWQKFAILLAMFSLLILVIYAVTNDIGGTAKKIYDAFINAVKSASSKVAEAASKIEPSVEGLKAAANVFIKAFVAPFTVLFETLEALANVEVLKVVGVFAVSIASALGILYYRGKPKEVKES